MKYLLLTFFSFSFILSFGQNNWMFYDTSNSDIPGNYVVSMDFEANGAKWFGTVYNGVTKFDNGIWQSYNTSNSGLIALNNQATYIDSDNNKWFASGWSGKISKYDGSIWTVYDSSNTNGIIVNQISTKDFITDKFGNILLGTSNNGILSFDGSSWSRLSQVNGNFIYDLTLDNSNNLWIGHWNDGASYFDGTNTINYNTNNSILPSNDVTSIAIENSGIIWMTTRYNGIVKLDGVNFTVYNTSNTSFPSNSFGKVVIDQNNIKWFASNTGTGGNGLVRFDDMNWTTLNTTNSNLPDNVIRAMKIDNNNNLWMGTLTKGVVVYNENGIVSTEEINFNESNISCWPNPAKNSINLISKGTEIKYESIKIYNSIGQMFPVIFPIITNINTELDISNLTEGIYFISIKTQQGKEIIKFIKQ